MSAGLCCIDSKMSLREDEADRQLEQMAKFILEEARDKAREIGIKADDDFQRELAKTVQEERQKLLADQEKKKKNFETKKRMYPGFIRCSFLFVVKCILARTERCPLEDFGGAVCRGERCRRCHWRQA